MLVLARALVLAQSSGASEIGIDHLLAALDASFSGPRQAIEMSGAQGAGGAQASPVSFDILAAGLTESSFTGNAGGWFFGVDVYNSVLNTTSPIGTGGTAVPEPSSIGLLGAALVGIGFWRKRAQQSA
jgi:PEP-CTERM motif-containing protein